MENKVKPKIGDVFWNTKGNYGKIYIEVSGDSKTTDHVMFSKTGLWAGYSPTSTLRVADDFVLLFNLHDLLKDCINESSN